LLTATPKEVMIRDSANILMLLHFNDLNRSFYYQPRIGMKKLLANHLVKSGALPQVGINATGVDKFESNYGYSYQIQHSIWSTTMPTANQKRPS